MGVCSGAKLFVASRDMDPGENVVESIRTLPHALHELDLEHHDVNDDTIAALITLPQMPELRCLSLKGTSVTDVGAKLLATLLRNTLVGLDLSETPIGDEGLIALVSANAHSLSSLKLPINATAAGASAAVAMAKGLVTLSFVKQARLTDEGLVLMIGSLSLLSTQSRVFQRCAIELNDCPNITDSGLESMAKILGMHLERFFLASPGAGVSERGIGHVVRNCRDIRTLCIKLCGATGTFTDMLLESIAMCLRDTLQRLVLCGFKDITQTTIDAVLPFMPVLRSVKIDKREQCNA